MQLDLTIFSLDDLVLILNRTIIVIMVEQKYYEQPFMKMLPFRLIDQNK